MACAWRSASSALAASTMTRTTGSVRQLCASAERVCAALGYEPVFLTDRLSCEAREAGAFLAAIARSQAGRGRRAFILGGETVVHLTGDGLGGRNQELVLSAARGMDGLTGALLFSVGSDGTDGPTDAAGGWVDGNTAAALREKGIDIERFYPKRCLPRAAGLRRPHHHRPHRNQRQRPDRSAGGIIRAATRRFLYEARPKTVFSDGLRCAYGGEMRRILLLKLRRRTKGGASLKFKPCLESIWPLHETFQHPCALYPESWNTASISRLCTYPEI